jgi:hypothetical protein
LRSPVLEDNHAFYPCHLQNLTLASYLPWVKVMRHFLSRHLSRYRAGGDY